VNKATVVLSGRTAYVGLDIKAGTEKARTDAIKRDVANRVKRAEPRLARVLVTTDTDTVTRLNRVASGMARGKPISAFTDEMREINRRMTPVSR
jgi:YhcN/YlaJ family sporulation lipoprotein